MQAGVLTCDYEHGRGTPGVGATYASRQVCWVISMQARREQGTGVC
jgi:hypothetical protein